MDHFINAFLESIAVKQSMLQDLAVLEEMAKVICKSLENGGKLLLCGNGGSAADAQHLAAELLIRLRSHVNRPSLPALSLALDPSTLTACGNDFGYDEVFSRPLSGLGKAGDVLLGISTSGKSSNVNKALELAHNMKITACGFLGGDGGLAKDLCQFSFIIPSHNTARIQECHITAGHALMERIENLLYQQVS